MDELPSLAPDERQHFHPHVVVVGSGGAGLASALRLAQAFPHLSILILAEGDPRQGNTYYAQGGIAIVVDPEDATYHHVRDTLIAGDGYSSPLAAEFFAQNAPSVLQWLTDLGLTFDQRNGTLDLGREGGHSHHRIVHIKDHTGRDLVTFLAQQLTVLPNVRFWFDARVVRLHRTFRHIDGLTVVDLLTGQQYRIDVPAVILATGGSGYLWQFTSNSPLAIGSGLVLAQEIGALLRDVEFTQFHPTALYLPEADTQPLITEALRGAGAILRNSLGEPFMQRYDERADLAPRDIVARAIYQEMKRLGTPHVWLDATSISDWDRFPTVLDICLQHNIDPRKEWIPVVPAAHYQCGGIRTDVYGRTCIEGLWATGEVACTELHGANRLASNSLLELLVQAYRLPEVFPDALARGEIHPSGQMKLETHLRLPYRRLRQVMHEHVGVVRHEAGLRTAEEWIQGELSRLEAHAWQDVFTQRYVTMLRAAQLIVQRSLNRRINCGTFYREDGLAPRLESA